MASPIDDVMPKSMPPVEWLIWRLRARMSDAEIVGVLDDVRTYLDEVAIPPHVQLAAAVRATTLLRACALDQKQSMWTDVTRVHRQTLEAIMSIGLDEERQRRFNQDVAELLDATPIGSDPEGRLSVLLLAVWDDAQRNDMSLMSLGAFALRKFREFQRG